MESNTGEIHIGSERELSMQGHQEKKGIEK